MVGPNMVRTRTYVLALIIVLLAAPLALRGATTASADSGDKGDHGQKAGNGNVAIQATSYFDTKNRVESDRANNPASRYSSTSSSNLVNHFGPVMNGTVTVYLIYWGWACGTSCSGDPAVSYVNGFFAAAGGSSWLKSVTQYSGATNSYSISPIYDGTVVPTTPSSQAIANEAGKYAFSGGGTNKLYLVLTPTGHSESGFGTQWCGYHSYASFTGGPTFAYSSVPFQPDAPVYSNGTSACGAWSVDGNVYDGYSIVGGHELGEAITDVYLNAWYDRRGAENGDKCAWTNLTAVTMPTSTKWAVQPLWSNKTSSCVLTY
jgi:hypothetical protein